MKGRLCHLVVLLTIVSIITAACGGAEPTVPPAETAEPTDVPAPTDTDAPADTPEPTDTETSASARGFIEPPFLADRVDSGELPPIDERLPEEPFVVGPGVLLQEEYLDWEDGQYGGEIQAAPTFPTGFVNIAGGATILRSPSQTTAASRPNVVSDYSFSDDYTTFTFTMREGLRWSDGTPVTTEDVRFTIEDLYMDPDVQRPWPTQLYAQGRSEYGSAELTVVDDYVFKLTFSQPYGYFIADLNSWIPYYDFLIKPSHYLKQFHAKYADEDELASLLEENNETSWVQLLNSKDVVHWDVGNANAFGMPVLNAWVLAQVEENRRVFERNPYFWHVDSNGRQLPYVDRVVMDIVIDTDAQNNAILAGQVTIATGGETALSKMPIYVQNAERGGFRIFTTGSFNYPPLLFLNHDYQYEDPESVWQQLITDPNRRFGQAIAAAIDPVEINKTVYFGAFDEPILNNKDYDPELAEQLLDEVGMDQFGDDGYRLGPDGEPFIFRITHPAWSADFDPVAELLNEYLEAVGINTEVERVDGTLFDERKAANEIMASITWNDGPAWEPGISEDYLPAHKGPWSPMTWTYFTTNGEEGREPPEYIQEFYDLHTTRKEFPPASAEGQAIFEDMMQWFEENYAFIPSTGLRTKPNIVDKRLRNVPNEGAPFELDTYINAEGMWFAEE